MIISEPYASTDGYVVPGGKCVPGTRTPALGDSGWAYEVVCQSGTEGDGTLCAHLECETAAPPAHVWAVFRYPLTDPTARESMGAGCYTDTDDPPKVTPDKVLRRLREIAIPPGAISVQPPNGRTLVNFETIVSTDAAPYEHDLVILGQDVHLWLRPVSFAWDFGDQTILITQDPGRPWAPGESGFITHEYAATGEVALGLSVTWTADFAVEGGDPVPVQGSVDIASDPVALTVLEARPHLVG